MEEVGWILCILYVLGNNRQHIAGCAKKILLW